MHVIGLFLLLAPLSSGASAPGAADQTQGAADQTIVARWTPFLGCWQLVEERSNNEHVATRACFELATAGDGVQLTTYTSDQNRTTRSITADGRSRPIEDASCRGNERVEWSANGTRLYRTSELTCSGEPKPRRVSGIGLLPNAGTWVDIEVVNDTVQVRRFFREGDRPAAATLTTAPFSVDDVREASRLLAPRAIEAAIVESHARFPLSGRTLLALDDAGVADSVIDLMVAVSYPDKFVVDRPGVPPGRISGGSAGGGFWGPWFGLSAEYQGPYDPYGTWTFFGSRAFFIDPVQYSTASPSGGSDAVNRGGVAVNGAGYTRVRTSSEVSSSRSHVNNGSTVSGRAVFRGANNVAVNSGGGDASSSSSGSSSSGGVSSSGGYSSGGADSGRTAEPR